MYNIDKFGISLLTKHFAEGMVAGGTMNVVSPVPPSGTSLIVKSPSSSSSSPNLKLPVSTDLSVPFSYSSSACCCCDGESCRKPDVVDGKVERRSSDCLNNHVFDAVPSQWEIQDALLALQNFMQPVISGAQQLISGAYDSSILLPHGYNRLYDALQLLQTDLSVKRLVVSLASDKAVWDAVMSNVLNRKLHVLPNSAERRRPQVSDEPELSIEILSWILEIIKVKVGELIEKFQSLMNDLFQSPKIEKPALDDAELEGKVRSSMLLSVVILLIVIVARVQGL